MQFLFVQNSEMMHSPSQDALIRVYSKISEASMDKSSSVPARLLVPAQHIGCLLGKGGSIIAEMRKVTGASIRIFGNEQIPRCAQRNEELVQVCSSSTNQPLQLLTFRAFVCFDLADITVISRLHALFIVC